MHVFSTGIHGFFPQNYRCLTSVPVCTPKLKAFLLSNKKIYYKKIKFEQISVTLCTCNMIYAQRNISMTYVLGH